MTLADRIQERRERRADREGGRKRLLRIASELYESGDDAESLREKVELNLEQSGESKPGIAFLLQLLETFLPLLLRLLAGAG